MRGAPIHGSKQSVEVRIIPADAGSTKLCHTSNIIVKDHPRGCGEHVAIWYRSLLIWGSSPRMRGALFYSIPV